MRKQEHNSGILRVGIFYDGNYFSHVSNYYLYEHQRKARLSISGLHEFVREQVAKEEGIDRRYCQIVDAHYFRGRKTAKKALEQNEKQLYKDRQWDDVLIREGVTMHFLPLAGSGGNEHEKGIDVWFALEAFELAMYKRFDVSVLVTGDGDFVPLVRKLNTLGTRVMLLAWDFESSTGVVTRAAQGLIDEVTYPIMMHDEVDSRSRKDDRIIEGMFLQSPPRETRRVSNDGLLEGQIATINAAKGFAHIQPDAGGENRFVHASDIPQDIDLTELKQGDRVKFKPTVNPKTGGPAAEIVEIL